MTRTLAVAAVFATMVCSGMVAAGEAVEIRLRGHYYAAPATVMVTVAVEPDARNRTLRIEADGDSMFRASAVELVGEGEKRLHTVQFRNLAAGAYTLRAEVYSSDDSLLAVAEQELVVAGH